MPTLKKNHLVQKRNVLNEIRSSNMTLQELRFFSIYLSKINKNKPEETRVVRFPMADFQSIMDLGRIDIGYMKNVTNSLLCKVVNVPIKDEVGNYRGYTGFQLFKECTVSNDDSGEWYVEIDAHDKALPLMFDFKNKYFTYKIDNMLRLRSPNQFRMYEILKQYETAGERILSVEELKSFIGIGKDEYPRYNDFKNRVLDACQQALAEHTDIKFTYEPHGRKGKAGKILALKFIIEKNEDFTDQLTLDMFVAQNAQNTISAQLNLNDLDSFDATDLEHEGAITSRDVLLVDLRDIMKNEFTIEQVDELLSIAMSRNLVTGKNAYLYFKEKYATVKRVESGGGIKTNLFRYLRGIINKE